MLFKWLFRRELAAFAAATDTLRAKDAVLDVELAVAREAADQIVEVLERVQAAEAHATVVAPLVDDLLNTVASQIAGFTARYNALAVDTAATTAVLSERAKDSVMEIRGSFESLVDARVKAEMAKWAFSGGVGGAIAAQQYCVRCAVQTPRWAMLPDEGPVCAKCLDLHI